MQLQIPFGLFTIFGKFGYNLFSYLNKGPKIDLHLEIISSEKDLLGTSENNASDSPTLAEDTINVYNFTSNFKLVFKNTSSNPAYNIIILKGQQYFNFINPLPQNLLLLPTDEHTVDCQIVTKNVHASNREFDQYFGVPSEIRNNEIIVSYQNEARNTFYTIFKINHEESKNEYSLRLKSA